MSGRRIAVLAAAFLTAAPAAAQTAPADPNAIVPVEVFAELPKIESPRLSPNGTHVAAKMAIAGTQYLVVLPLFGNAKPAVTKVGQEVDINWWRWVGDNWLVVGVGQQQPFEGDDVYLHGKADKRVPVKQSRQMADALRAAGKPYLYIEQPLGDHHFTRGEDRLEFLKAMGAFLAQYKPGLILGLLQIGATIDMTMPPK